MVEYEIEHLNKQYEELYNKLRSAAYSLLDVDPISHFIDVDILHHRAFDICFVVVECGTDSRKVETIPADVIDKFYEVNRDAAMALWGQIKQRREQSKRISDRVHRQLDFTGVEGNNNEQNIQRRINQ